MSKYVNTETAARELGLSAYELRRGWKAGVYPALVIGTGAERPRLRWNLDAVQAAMAKASEVRRNERMG